MKYVGFPGLILSLSLVFFSKAYGQSSFGRFQGYNSGSQPASTSTSSTAPRPSTSSPAPVVKAAPAPATSTRTSTVSSSRSTKTTSPKISRDQLRASLKKLGNIKSTIKNTNKKIPTTNDKKAQPEVVGPTTEIYDSTFVIGPRESIQSFRKRMSKERPDLFSYDEKLEEQEKKESRFRRANNFRGRNISQSQDKDYSKMSPEELRKEKEAYWQNYYESEGIKVRRKR